MVNREELPPVARQFVERFHPHVVEFLERNIVRPNAGRGAKEVERAPFERIPSITNREATMYGEIIWKSSEEELYKDTYPQFEKKIISAMRSLHESSQIMIERAAKYKELFEQTPDYSGGYTIFLRFLPKTKLLRHKVRDVEINANHVEKWGETPRREVKRTVFPGVSKRFFLRPGFFAHPEAPFYLVADGETGLFKKKRERIASVGFILHSPTPGETVLAIKNIQGVEGKARALEGLSKSLGENWRLSLVRSVMEHAKANGFRIEGEPPEPPERVITNWDTVKEEKREKAKRDYKRQARQYAQTYKKLGFVRKGEHWVLPA